ncbi:phenylalanine--tRNA ligase subunit beta [Alphaproteobacteria bacterium endosymbiont of Tiliacea citrago]|uniref:phenylalanine--tRNA ligase subunit beta n=1 Tax=Alphaproteobacteria bacterium endosymbiont of Tiliacea citrago TaxID=3077944 RepID=UPI00313D76D3
MKVTMNWLKDYLETELTYKEIIKNLNKLGFELKKDYSSPALWKSIEIVKIIEKNKHANAEKLNLYSIQKKTGEILTIVCGDSNLEINNFVPYAMPGTVMPSGITLTTATIRGIDSPGMLCSAKEINLPSQDNGVLKCAEEDWGKSIAEAYESEAIFEIELTPNRGDALSIFGLARILANEDLGILKEPKEKEFSLSEQQFFEIKSSDCRGLICTFCQHEPKSTPNKIIKRLMLTEHAILNLDVIDLTNYLSHDLGLPLHVFDYDKIKNNPCSIENLTEEQEFETLAQQKIKFKKDTLVFKSGENIISWPAVIGGENSKVDENTKNILLEAGVFPKDSMQRRKNGVITSAVKKAEYGFDPFILKKVSNRFFEELNLKPISQQYKPFLETKKIPFNFSKVKEILGSNIQEEDFKKIMIKKGFTFNSDETITPPSYKFFDITTENCIIEEFAIARYDSIYSINLSPRYASTINKEKNYLSELSLNCGFNECKNISLGKLENENFQISTENRKVINYSNQNYSVLRGSLIPDLLKNASWHVKNQQKIYNFFEIGLIYGDFENKQTQMYTAISNNTEDLRILLSKILNKKQIEKKVFSREDTLIAHAKYATSFYFNNEKFAALSAIKPQILKEFGLKEYYALEIFPEKLIVENGSLNNNLESAPIYQDITFKLSEQVSASKVTNFLNFRNLDYKILIVYPNNNINEERKLTVQLKLEQKENETKEQINEKIENLILAFQQY